MITQDSSRDTNRRQKSQAPAVYPDGSLDIDYDDLDECPAGVQFQSAIDWLQGTVTLSDAGCIEEFVRALTPLDGDSLEIKYNVPFTVAGATRYQHHGRSPGGSLLAFSESEDSPGLRCFFQVPGGVLRSLTLQSQLRLQWWLYSKDVKFTRIDLAVNDYTRRFEPYQINEWCLAGRLRRFHQFSFLSPRCSHYGSTARKGDTLYLGSRQSGRYFRIYDCRPKHNYNAVRYEQEFKRGYAPAIARALYEWDGVSDDSEALNRFIASKVFGGIDFVSESYVDERQLARCDTLAEWAEFVADVCDSPSRVCAVPAPVRTLDVTINWLRRQCSRSLAILSHTFGVRGFDKFIRSLREGGEGKLDDFARSRIKFGRAHLSELRARYPIDDGVIRSPGKLRALGGS